MSSQRFKGSVANYSSTISDQSASPEEFVGGKNQNSPYRSATSLGGHVNPSTEPLESQNFKSSSHENVANGLATTAEAADTSNMRPRGAKHLPEGVATSSSQVKTFSIHQNTCQSPTTSSHIESFHGDDVAGLDTHPSSNGTIETADSKTLNVRSLNAYHSYRQPQYRMVAPFIYGCYNPAAGEVPLLASGALPITGSIFTQSHQEIEEPKSLRPKLKVQIPETLSENVQSPNDTASSSVRDEGPQSLKFSRLDAQQTDKPLVSMHERESSSTTHVRPQDPRARTLFDLSGDPTPPTSSLPSRCINDALPSPSNFFTMDWGAPWSGAPVSATVNPVLAHLSGGIAGILGSKPLFSTSAHTLQARGSINFSANARSSGVTSSCHPSSNLSAAETQGAKTAEEATSECDSTKAQNHGGEKRVALSPSWPNKKGAS